MVAVFRIAYNECITAIKYYNPKPLNQAAFFCALWLSGFFAIFLILI
jgi:hypothetical protein